MLAAARGKNGGAVRLWFLAKNFDIGGCGAIPNKAFRQYVINDLKVKRGTYDVRLSRALKIGLLERQGKYLKLAGYARAAVIVGVKRVKRPAYISLGKFINNGWLAWVWAAWIKSNKLEGRPISRKALRIMSGVPERTQREYEKKAGVYNQSNYAKDLTRSPDQIGDIALFERSGVFLYQGQITWRLPNSREVRDIEEAPKGRIRRINSRLKDLYNNGGRDPQAAYVRVYCQSDKQLDMTQKTIRRLGNKDVDGLPDWIYKASSKEGFWCAIPT